MAKTFSEMLYEKMNIRGVMQADLCRGLCSTTAMSRYLQGERRIDRMLLTAFLQRLGMSPDKFTTLALFMLVTFFILITVTGRKIEPLGEALAEAMEQYTNKLREIFSAFDIIKSYNLREKTGESFTEASLRAQESRRSLGRLEAKVGIVAQTVVSCILLMFMVYEVFMVKKFESKTFRLFIGGSTASVACSMQGYKNVYTVGRVVFLLLAISILLVPGIGVFEQFAAVKAGKATLNCLDEAIKVVGEDGASVDFGGKFDKISAEGVSARYGERTVFDNVDFEIKAGKKYLITGASGCGKSTLLKLLRKYMKPQDGKLSVDNCALSDITVESWFSHTAYLSQQVFLFADTLYNNICMFRDCDREKLDEVIGLAGLAELVKSVPGGLAYRIEDNGRNLSGGERARVALARALMSNAGIILLDEPFAHLDSGNTHEIEKGLLAIEGKTLVNVSHVIDNENAAQYDEVWYIENKNITKFSPYILLNEIKIVQCNEYLCCFLFVFVNLLTQNHINGIIQKSKNVNMNKIRLQYMKKWVIMPG
ncbi:aBC transporter related [Firmicutes bacterium CAG:882]|nr:aBC transporter related [Firmicutes bacterium CAG:882]